MADTIILSRELETFAKMRDQLLTDHEDKWALISGDRLIDTFTSHDDALKRGYEECGEKPFLLKQIKRYERSINFQPRIVYGDR